MRALATAATRRPIGCDDHRYVWWPHVPRRLQMPAWWLWTLELAHALAGDAVAVRCCVEGVIALWPPIARRR